MISITFDHKELILNLSHNYVCMSKSNLQQKHYSKILIITIVFMIKSYLEHLASMNWSKRNLIKIENYRFAYQNKLVFFMILMNSYSLIYPSPSLSASSIIYWSYSSVIVSPNSRATLFKFFKETLPVLSSSNNLKAFKIYSLGSR